MNRTVCIVILLSVNRECVLWVCKMCIDYTVCWWIEGYVLWVYKIRIEEYVLWLCKIWIYSVYC
jgi:hypothetical protein